MEDIKFIKIRDVKSPERGTSEAAGIDFFIPWQSENFAADLKEKNPNIVLNFDTSQEEGKELEIEIPPHGRVLIPSGIKTWMKPGTALIAANKSGIASKKGLIFGAQVVDSDYTGEIHISIINTTKYNVWVNSGDKMMQFIHTPVLLSNVVEITEDEFNRLHENSQRGSEGFGSTGLR